MSTQPVVHQPYDLTTFAGREAAEKFQYGCYDLLMQRTARERAQFLEAKGWKRVSIEKTDKFVRVNWHIPAERQGPRYYTIQPQTRALLQQIWWNMVEKGVVKTGEEIAA